MKDEIKEILEDYKKLAGEITLKLDNTAEYESWLIIQEYFDRLLDYITNLQRKYDKALTDLVHESHKRIELENKITILQEELEEQKQIIDKAIEYIEKTTLFTEDYDYDYEENLVWKGATDEKESEELLNILKGEE